MGYKTELIYVNDDCYEIIRVMATHNFIVPKRHPNRLDKELIGLWVHHLGGERVLRRENNLLIVKKVEEANYEEVVEKT